MNLSPLVNVLRIILIGPPGCGKGTQAHFLCGYYHLIHVSTGELLRRHAQEGTELGKVAGEIMAAGALMPDPLIFDMLADLYRRENGGERGFVLDGFPRSRKQAAALNAFLLEQGESVSRVLLLELDDEVVVERLIGRRTCPKCGRSYHLLHLPPQSEGVCDDDGATLIWREDDHEDVIRNRLKTYHEETDPVVRFYDDLGLLTRIDGSLSITEVGARMREVIDTLQGTAV